jgi:hypothetical protein
MGDDGFGEVAGITVAIKWGGRGAPDTSYHVDLPC